MKTERAGKVGGEAHRPRIEYARVHRIERWTDLWLEIHVGENVRRKIETWGDLNQYRSSNIEPENSALGHIDDLLTAGRADLAVEANLLDGLYKLAVLSLL